MFIKNYGNIEYVYVLLKEISWTLNYIYNWAHPYKSILTLLPRGEKDWKETYQSVNCGFL